MIEAKEWPLLRGALAFVSAVVLGAGGLSFGFFLSLVAAVILMFGLGFELTLAAQLVLGLVFVQGFGCAGVALTYVKIRPYLTPAFRELLDISEADDRFRIGASVPTFRELLIIGGGYLLALGGAIAGSFIVALLEVDTGTNQAAAAGLENPDLILILIPASILIVGPGEELLFRGVVQGRFREIFEPISGVLVPSAVFAGLHWFAISGGSPTGNLVGLSILLVPAIVLGVSYEYTRNIVVPSVIHGIYNATLFTLLYASIVLSDQLPEPSTFALSVLF